MEVGSFPPFLAILDQFAADKAVPGAEEFGHDQHIVVAEAAGFLPVVPVLVGTGDGGIEHRAGFRLIPPDTVLEGAVHGPRAGHGSHSRARD